MSYETGLIQFFLSRERLLAFLHSLGPYAFVGFILLQTSQVVVAPIPGEVTGLLGGYLYGPILGVALSTVGLTLGSYLAFILSRAFGRPFVERFVNKATMERFDYLLQHKGSFVVFLLFLIPGFPKDYLCYILGLGHLSTLEFLLIGTAGRLLGTILLTFGGACISQHQYLRLFILIVFSLVAVGLALVYHKKLERLFRIWYVREYRRKRAKRLRKSTQG